MVLLKAAERTLPPLQVPAVCMIVCPILGGRLAKVRKTPSWPRSWANFTLCSCIPTGIHGPTCIFWANLTPFSLEAAILEAAPAREGVMLQAIALVQQP